MRQQRSIQSELEAEREGRRQALVKKAKAQAERNVMTEREQKAQTEIERLKALLEEKERKHYVGPLG